MRAGGLVAFLENHADGPLIFPGAFVVHDGAKGVLQTLFILGGATDFDVSDETEEGATPVHASPCLGVIEAAIAGLWFAFMHVVEELVPDKFWREISGLGAG